MIRFILLQNRQGKTRLAKYYVPLEESEKHKVEYEVHRLVVNRDSKFTNFVEFRTHKVIYRRYAGLFFSLCVDITDNELAYLECIHLFVEILDHFFSNVCELDLVFNFHKAIIERMSELEKLD
ncbi:AP-2 complex subunit sigma isoform X2 [Eutrema salsugineum]|uniref:AP-2 complex subunit sigma isoform X2 n=1 Tax=Eutrema salsugineum TaxID=72664 RepID=UPI000CED25EF|nr:AP-2 complex subunit sigma isoform X2 [Eutrema salsugineum]